MDSFTIIDTINMTPPTTPSHSVQTTLAMHAETCYGYVNDLEDALLIVQLCIEEKLPLVEKRLSLFEREAIRSGSIFCFIEGSSTPAQNDSEKSIMTPPRRSKNWQPMRRWTDGLVWSKSRVNGNFLVYKEMAEKRSMNFKRTEMLIKMPDDLNMNVNVNSNELHSSVLKSEGLMKKTFSIILDGQVIHVINYYNEHDVRHHLLPTPLIQFPNIKIEEKYLDPSKLKLKSSSHNTPKSITGYPKPRRSVKKRKQEESSSPSSDSSSPNMMSLENVKMEQDGLFNLIEASISSSSNSAGNNNDTKNGDHAVNSNGGFITLRQLEPEVANVQIPLPGTLKDLKSIATKTFRLTTPHILMTGPHGEVNGDTFPFLVDGDQLDLAIEKRRLITDLDSTAEAALALTRLASAE